MALAAIDAQRCRTIFNDFPQKSLGQPIGRHGG